MRERGLPALGDPPPDPPGVVGRRDALRGDRVRHIVHDQALGAHERSTSIRATASATTEEVIAWVRRHNIRLLATTPDTDTAHTAVDYRGGVAIAVGTEKEGLTDTVLDAADARVRIAMVGRVNSLNAATAAAVVVYEAVRQRSS